MQAWRFVPVYMFVRVIQDPSTMHAQAADAWERRRVHASNAELLVAGRTILPDAGTALRLQRPCSP
jgi:hypothetical protein